MNRSPARGSCPGNRRPRVAAMLLLAVLAWSGIAAAAVSARFDRDQVHEGETVTLIIELEGLGGGTPDLSALAADFEVLGTSSGSRIQIINGRQSATRSWQVTLAPKRLGTIEVPPIAVAGQETRPLALSVGEMPQAATGGPGDDVFLELSVGDAGSGPLYVQQQVPVRVRLYSALPLRGGELSEPRPQGAMLERLGEDLLYDANRNGRQYQVIERHFSLSPERSGELRIPPVTFTGELRQAGGRSPFGNDRLAQLFRDPLFDRLTGSPFERGEPVRARSRAVALEVLPQPDGFTGRHWLPAAALAIDDSWERDPPQLTRGEPAERRLTVTATGLAGSQIPEIEMTAPDSVRVYPEGVETETRTDGTRLFGISRQRINVIPGAGGTLEFPEIRLHWWDVRAGKEQVVVVPARRLVAAGSVGAVARSPAGAHPAAGAMAADEAAGAPPAQADRRHPVRGPTLWLLALGLGIAAGALLWIRRRPVIGWWRRLALRVRSRGPVAAAPPREGDEPASAGPFGTSGDQGARDGRVGKRRAAGHGSEPLDTLRAACAEDDARAAASGLLALARHLYGAAAPANLGGVAARFAQAPTPAGQRAAAAVRGLEASLYGPHRTGWDGTELAAALAAALADLGGDGPMRTAAGSPLAPLYPRRC